MKFKDAVLACHQLSSGYQDDLKALLKAHRSLIECAEKRGSVNVDETLRKALPNDPRWDYGIGYYGGRKEKERAVWVEVHPANSEEVEPVLAKARWLQQWLKTNARDLLAMTRDEDGFVWLAAGSVALRPGSPQAIELAQAGLSFPRRRLRLP